MKLLSVSVGRPREIQWRGETVLTSIFKDPVPGRVRVGWLNLEGDEQSDLSVHGGVDKAVYAYPGEHYPPWREDLPGMDLSWAFFGENLTTEGLDERTVHIGDRLRIGSAEFLVTQPRMPCFKLAIRAGRQEIGKLMLQSGRTGFYLSVQQEGEVEAGDPIEVIDVDERGLSIADVVSLYTTRNADTDLLRRAAEHPVLPDTWRDYFYRQLTK
jgi:MOSC domain-containing protein YiiM